MFTGIIEKTAPVKSLSREAARPQLEIETGYLDLEIGESVAVNGVCLTVEKLEGTGRARFDLSHETLKRTQLGSLREGSVVNLERALPANGRLSGHWVQGHVDAVGKWASVTREGEGFRVEVEVPATCARYCAEKGSITVNGVSLTVGEVKDQSDGVTRVALYLIPLTWDLTHFAQLQIGDAVNLEVDILAKYVERLLSRK